MYGSWNLSYGSGTKTIWVWNQDHLHTQDLQILMIHKRAQILRSGSYKQWNGRAWLVTPWTVPPWKWSPQTVHGRIIGPPGPNIAAIPGLPCCRLRPFHNCLCHSTCILRTVWTLPVQSKQGEATPAEVSAGRWDDTTPIEEESA